MEITVIAVGKIKSAFFKEQLKEYKKRLPWRIQLFEVEEKKKLKPEQLKHAESDLIKKHIPPTAYKIILDENGNNISSINFAQKLSEIQNHQTNKICFIIGGAFGIDKNLIKQADLLLSFGKLTWPHQLVRTMLYEQIYRAYSINTGHPYHKE